ncbi:hypothetical protein Dgeo_2369 (plasmid) [Deinococcus geothermalis DSM 11300]|uniref:Uncharacterized protein n=1 Tax=Deinococcus geothermalis (strain DSM 11300 / CIP 105573 / AG-3a) TaxID=319795 RepID=Q1J3X4_DEIGD|nr:hypothetical protein Dgeo_2369 [Deinococcus geothermalis DSM 11300]
MAKRRLPHRRPGPSEDFPFVQTPLNTLKTFAQASACRASPGVVVGALFGTTGFVRIAALHAAEQGGSAAGHFRVMRPCT